MAIDRGSLVLCRNEKAPGSSMRPGLVIRVSQKHGWADVSWGGWAKRMQLSALVKPKEWLAPGFSTNDVTAYLMQPDGEDWPPTDTGTPTT